MIVTPNGTPVWVNGAGRTVILVHGLLMDHRMWEPQVSELSKHYRVCCIDLFGHGEAPDPPGERSLDDFVSQVHEVVTQFSESGPPVLGGFSMGALIAQTYAVRHHKNLGGVMLMSGIYDRSEDESARVRARFERNVASGVENAVGSAARRWFKASDYALHSGAIEKILGWIREGDFVAKRKAQRVFVTSGAELTGALGVIDCPVLVMTGADDTGSTPRMSRAMADAIKNARLEILDGQHHMMTVLDALRVNTLIVDFLSSNIRR